MANDRKNDQALDDWDSLPLDPAADDWDEAPSPPAPPEEQAPSEEQAPPEEQAQPEEPAQPPRSLADPPTATEDDFEDEAAEPSNALPGDPGDDDFDAPSPAPPPPEDAELYGAFPDEPDDDDFDAPSPAAPPPEAPGPFDAFLGGNAAPDGNLGQVSPPGPAPADAPENVPPEPEADKPGAQLTGKKVELDIEDIFLDDLAAQLALTGPPEEEPPEEPPDAPEEPPAAEEPPSPPEDAIVQKIPLIKLMVVVVPALVLLCGLSWGVYRLFFYLPPPPPPVLVIDPTVPPRVPEPGEMALKPFYVNFAGESETIVEMTITLHYNDAPDRELIEANLPSIREAIFRLTRNKGHQVVTSGELQRALRQEMILGANAALGAEIISYIQLNQFRILH